MLKTDQKVPSFVRDFLMLTINSVDVGHAFMNIAFVGLGTMGGPMVRNLLQAGHSVTVHNRTRTKEQ
ncbi:MAG: NAD(P)-binding domain-containing protein, partial [Saprospiraceae bacterium]